MPLMDGFEFLRNFKLSGRNVNVPVLALTGLGRSVERAQAEGFYAHLTKPLDLDVLLKTLRNIPRKN